LAQVYFSKDRKTSVISTKPEYISSESEYEIDGKESDFEDPYTGEKIYDLMEILDKSLRLKRYQQHPKQMPKQPEPKEMKVPDFSSENIIQNLPLRPYSPTDSELPVSSSVSTLSSQKQHKKRKRRKSKRMTKLVDKPNLSQCLQPKNLDLVKSSNKISQAWKDKTGAGIFKTPAEPPQESNSHLYQNLQPSVQQMFLQKPHFTSMRPINQNHVMLHIKQIENQYQKHLPYPH